MPVLLLPSHSLGCLSLYLYLCLCLCLPLPLPLLQLLFGCPKQCLCPLLLLFWLLKFFSLLFLQFCFHPATLLAASTSTFASTSPSACHCHFLCHNYYLVVINSVCVFYCSFSGCFNLFFLFFLQFCFLCIVDILCALCTLFLLSSTVCLSSPFLFIHFHNLFSLYLAFLKTFLRPFWLAFSGAALCASFWVFQELGDFFGNLCSR